jgi:uncharacterized protein (DUF433 family)
MRGEENQGSRSLFMAHNRIVCDQKIMCGKPVIKGTRIKVEVILRWLGRGVSVDKLLEEYPGLTHEDVQAAQAFAAEYLADERVLPAAAE